MNAKLPLILYGAGANAVVEMTVVVRRGLNPTCFCDADERKHGTTMFGLPVLSLAQARDRWKEANYWITAGSVFKPEIIKYLTQDNDISQEYILNYERFETKAYRGCHLLETGLVIEEELMKVCCRQAQSPGIRWDCGGDIDSAISSFIEERDSAISSIRDGEPSVCGNCPEITMGNYCIDKKIQALSLNFDTPCQLSCTYCIRRNAVNMTDTSARIDNMISHFDYRAFLGTLEKRGLISENARIDVASGEISIDPRKQEILDVFEKYRLLVLTNAVIFDDALAEAGGKLGNRMNISVDAGTRGAYKKIKGLDAFDRVWDNIQKYREHGVDLVLKYIFLPENSDDENVENFINKASEVKPSIIYISANAIKTVPHTDEQIRLMAKMYRLAENNGMTPVIIPETMPGDDIVKIHEIRRDQCQV